MRKDLRHTLALLGMARQCGAWRGKQHSPQGEQISRSGLARRRRASRGLAGHGKQHSPKRGRRFLGKAGHGQARRGSVRQTTSPARGTVFMASQPRALQAGARRGIHASLERGTDFSAWHFLAWLSRAVLGSARQTTPPEREEDFWERLGQARRGAVRRGTANNTPQRWGEDFRVGLGVARFVKARPDEVWQTTLPGNGEKISRHGLSSRGRAGLCLV